MHLRAVYLKFAFPWLSLFVTLLFSRCEQAIERSAVTTGAADTVLRYAKRFGLQNNATYTVLTVYGNRENFDTTATFVLSRSLNFPTTAFKNQQNIQVPCKRIVSLSCIYSSMLAELESVDAIVGIDNSDYVNDTNVLKRIKGEHIVELSKGPIADLEATIALQPNLVLMFGMGNPLRDIPAGFTESKLPIVIVLDHLEEHPMARAEWLKFFATFVDKQKQADSIFKIVENNYLSLTKSLNRIDKRPTVFSEIKFGEAWYMPGGKSFMAILIADAGGDYLWKDVQQSGSIPLTLEQVLVKAGAADIWLNQPLLFSLKDIAAADKRYMAFKAYQKRQVFNNTLGRNSKGYSPYWESGMTHPDRILADLIKIFHPNLRTEANFYYYEQLKE